MFDRLDDTIVAVSSPPGVSLRGIVRLSGPQAPALAARVFTTDAPPALADAPGWSRHLGRVRIADRADLPAEAYIFRAPASYTRQDLIELHVPGSPAVLAMVLDQLTDAGARHAEPGEFTARAFFAGAMDLTEVEGVAALIHADNDSQLRASEALLHGQLSRQSNRLRDQLTDLLALLEARIDFAEEPEEFIAPNRILETIVPIRVILDQLHREAPAVEHLNVLPSVLLTGPPNAGKSTLFNRLTGLNRAIQAATAGTTRDLLSAPLTIPGGEILLIDSAGITRRDEEQDHQPTDDPDRQARQAARRALRQAHAVVLVLDASRSPHEHQRYESSTGAPTLRVANKIDLLAASRRTDWMQQAGSPPPLMVSAHTGQGIAELRAAIDDLLFSRSKSHENPLPALSNRQREALAEAAEALGQAIRLCTQTSLENEPVELITMELRSAVNALSLLTGQVMTDSLLERIFSRFCIGK
jgi:tRNA modification GTPase